MWGGVGNVSGDLHCRSGAAPDLEVAEKTPEKGMLQGRGLGAAAFGLGADGGGVDTDEKQFGRSGGLPDQGTIDEDRDLRR